MQVEGVVHSMRRQIKFVIMAASLLVHMSIPASAQEVPSPCPPDEASASVEGHVRYGACLAGSAAAGEVLARSIGLEVSTAPFGSTSGGFTFTFDPAKRGWTRTAPSFGPAFAERAPTSGRGQISAGVNFLRRSYDTVAGNDLRSLEIARLQGENRPADATTLDLKIASETMAVFGHVGVTKDLDVGVAVPFVRLDMEGLSRASRPGGGEFPPEPIAARSSGVTDIAIITKYRFWKPAPVSASGLAAMATVRVPTGNEKNLRGLGVTRTAVSLIGSGVIGRFSPHINAGYEFWSAGVAIPANFFENTTVTVKDQIVYAAGLEIEAHSQLTITVDVVGRYLRGGGRLQSEHFTYPPDSNEFSIPGATVLIATSKGLSTIGVAPGLKWNLWGSTLLSAHALITATGNGLRDRVTPVIGLDWAFALPTNVAP
jgi:hypothetical protein